MAGRMFSVKQAAALPEVNCHPETLRRAIRAKELLATRHPTKPGRPLEVASTDLAAFLERRRSG